MRFAAALIALSAAALLTSCSGCTGKAGPIESLEADSPSAEYDALYWQAEAEAESETWEEAIDFCREHAAQALPNCGVVLKTIFLHGLEQGADRPFPKYGEEGRGSTGVPKALQEYQQQQQPDSEEKKNKEDP